AQALPGGFNLPFPVGSTWYYTGGPHNYNGGTPGCISGSGCPRFWSSVDIAPPEVTSCSPGSTSYNSRWIVATRGGTVITSQTALVVIDHGDGWRTYYSHVSSTDRRGTGGVNQGDNLGHPSCEVEPSGFTSGIHVHFAIYQVGTGFINIAGSSLSGWSIGETSHYNGTMTRQGVNRTATTGRHNGTNDIINNGSGGGNECSSTISLPAGYTKCADETGTCNFNGTADVVFGSGNRYTLKSGVVNSISCSITAFGCDPNYGVQKECYYKITSGGSNTWSAKYFSGDTHWWDINSTNNQMCTDTLNGPNLDKNYGDDPACSGQSGDHWVGDYKSTINFSSGNYVFEVEHDDGLKLYLDGQNIAERGDYSTFQPICPARSISGNHELWAILREDGGQAKIKVNWSTNTSLCDSPGAFSKSSPSHGASTQPTSLTLNWGSSSGSNSYEYCIDTTNDNSCNTWVGVGNTTIANLSGLSEGTTYYWQVKATNFADPTYANGDLTAFWSFTTQSSQPLPDILYNGGFEEGYTVEPWAYPYGWYKTAWIMDNSTFTWDTTQKHSGNRSAKISNNTSNDARWTATVWVQPNADYRLSGWIKTENIAQNGDRGANLSILGGWISTTKLYGTNDWTFVSVDFNTEANEFIEVAARIGMYSGEISGTAWFDDLKLELLSSPTCYTLTTTSLPAEGGNVTVVTIPNCANGTQYVHGTMVSLAANSNSGYAFSNWNGANPTFVTPGRTIIASNKNVTANFNLSAPLNDDFNSAIDVALHSTENLDTRSATQNNDDPQIPACLMNAGKATVWYKYTPSTDSAISLDTKGADYDTFIAVWAGTRNLLIPVACNDDTGGTYQSAVAFQVQAGVTYYIEVGEWDGYYGASAMSVKPPVR
ncbi:MAG: peptidoglycan DD-metalloendopeptidase family protein, partial [Chloroflexi bacterium]|nr:peptidoglycan DD-metalloendopeptidase family protein [Chloroflexota bacterium]